MSAQKTEDGIKQNKKTKAQSGSKKPSEVKRKRGRPPTGKAIPDAERKRKQRRGSYTTFCVDVNDLSLHDVSLTAMLEFIPKAINLGRVDVVEKITRRIVKIAKDVKEKEEQKKLNEKKH